MKRILMIMTVALVTMTASAQPKARRNAAANNNRHGKTLEDLQRVNISATQRHFVSRDEDIFHEHQAECMVKTFIPIEYITNINSPSRIS